ncbi:MAG TPA: flagellar basal body-associated FliL family protein [Candidatus Elarobacter sp.]|nr:flagellar basal body-associated FliL family protein [Candidatus Elarobacter sp.]
MKPLPGAWYIACLYGWRNRGIRHHLRRARRMADENEPGNEDTTAEEAAPGSGKRALIPVIGSVVAGLALGGLIGVVALGPRLASPAAPAAKSVAETGAAATPPADEHAPADGGHKAADGPPPIYQIDNLVLNPAGSGGAHFLLMSVALEARDPAGVEIIKARDAELRDAILRLFGSKTSEQVAEASSRDQLRAEVLTAVDGMFGRGVVRKVYFPQFVIQ